MDNINTANRENKNQQLKSLKDKKNQLESKLIPYMETNNYHQKPYNIKIRKYILLTIKTYTNLSYKYIKQHMND